MDQSEVETVEYGTLLFFRKDGQPGTPYSFSFGKTTIGASKDADIRLKLIHRDLQPIHCLIDVNEYGIATLVNKSAISPVKINSNPIRIAKVLNHGDEIEVVGKKFKYLNDDLCEEDTEKCEQILREVIIASPVIQSQSVAPLVRSAKRTRRLKTKVPVRRQVPKRESFSGFSSKFTVTVTPRKRIGRRSLLEKAQTASKVLVSKALRSPISAKKRHLSLGGCSGSMCKNNTVSARNILLSESTISSTTAEGDEPAPLKPSQTMKDVEEVKEVAGFLDESNITIDVHVENSSPKQRMSLKTPSRSSVKVIVTGAPSAEMGTPSSKRTSLIRTLHSVKKLTPRVSARLSTDISNSEECIATPSNRRSSIKKPRIDINESRAEVTVESGDSPYNRHSSLGNLPTSNTQRFSEGVKRKFSSLEDDVSSEETLRLNLSSCSTVSPIKGFSQGSMEDISIEDSSSPRRSLLKKSLRKSQQAQQKPILPDMSTRKSSKRSSFLPMDPISDDFANKSSRKSELSLRKSEGIEEQKQNVSSSSDSVFEDDSMADRGQKLSRSNSLAEESSASFEKASARRSSRRNSFPDKLLSEKSFVHDVSNVSSLSSDSVILLPENSPPRRSKSLKNSQQRSTLNEEELLESPIGTDVETTPKTRQSTSKILSFRDDPSVVADKSVRKSRLSRRNSKVAEKEMMEDAQLSNQDSISENADSSMRSVRKSSGVKENEAQTPSTEPDIRRSVRKRSTPYRFSLDKSAAKADISNISLVASPIPKSSPFTPNIMSPRRSILKKSLRKSELIEEAELSNKGPVEEDYKESPIKSRASSARKSQIGLSSVESSARKSSNRSRIFFEDPQSQNELIQDIFVNKSVRRTMRKSINEEENAEKELPSLIEESIDEETNSYILQMSENMSNVKVLLTDCSVQNSSRYSVAGKRSLGKSSMGSKLSLTENQQDEDLSSEEDFELVLSDGSKGSSSPEKSLDSTTPEELKLETPKSALRSRRSKSTPYIPITEDVTPVSPIAKGKVEGGFKTPLNTPGLFENIRRSVLKSRSRTHRSSSSFIEELNESVSRTHAVKRSRESTDSLEKSTKRRKMNSCSQESSSGDSEGSFDSFNTEDILSDISDQNVFETPKHFSDLTDKPVINIPKTKSLTEPRSKKAAPTRRSLHAVRLESQLTATTESDIISSTSFSSEHSDSVFDVSSDSDIGSSNSQVAETKRTRSKVQNSPKNDLSDVAGLKKLLKTPRQTKSPKNDLSDVRGVKNILQTPKTIKTPKNDLRNVPNLRKFVSPQPVKTPKNDLTDIRGVKKLLRTPKIVNSPKNDLTDVRGVKRLLETPKTINSPKNDLTDIRGVKKLLQTPKVQNSPKNDLTNVPSLRNLMSPKTVKSPKNDLRNVVGIKRLFDSPKVVKSPKNDLRNVAGVKRLLSTPVAQNSPKNDLTNIPNLRRVMYPKQQNSPRNDLTTVHGIKRLIQTPKKGKEPVNDLTDVEGVANIFNVSVSNESDIENNENLFDKLFVKKPLKTYRGRSMSPSSRKAMLYKGDRKTLGDTPLSSPRVEKWVQEQAIMKSKTEDEVFKEVASEKKKPSRKQKRVEELEKVEADKPESPKRPLRGRRKAEKQESDHLDGDEIKTDTPETTSRRKAVAKHVETSSEVEETKDTDKVARRTVRGRKKAEDKQEVKVRSEDIEVGESDKKVSPKRTRGRRNAVHKPKEDRALEILKSEDPEKLESPKRVPRGRRIVEDKHPSEVTDTKELMKHPSEVLSAPKTTRGRKKAVKADDESSDTVDSALTAQPAEEKRSRSRKAAPKQDDQVAEVDSTTSEAVAPRRGRPRIAPIISVVESTDSEVASPAPKRRRPRNATKEEDDSSLEKGPAKQTSRKRGKAQATPKVEDEKDEENVEFVEPVPVKPEEPVKRPRGRPKKSAKQEEPEPAPEKATNKRTRRAAAEEEVVVDSPRTMRAKKGDFNKYGDEFVVESPRLESKTRKKVQFDDEVSDDQGKAKKLKGKNVEAEVEETTRRTRRTRK